MGEEHTGREDAVAGSENQQAGGSELSRKGFGLYPAGQNLPRSVLSQVVRRPRDGHFFLGSKRHLDARRRAISVG